MSNTPIKIGYRLSLSGGLAANGQTARLAQQIWQERVNARGGLLGREVELICVDDKSDAPDLGRPGERAKNGLDVVSETKYPLTATDFAPYLREAQQSSPDILFYCAYLNDSVGLIRAIAESEMNPLLVGGAMIGPQSSGTDSTRLRYQRHRPRSGRGEHAPSRARQSGSIRGTTRPVTLNHDVNGFSPDTFGATRVSFSATTTIDRNDFGVRFNASIPGLDHAMLLSDSVAIILDVEAVLQSDGSAG